MSAQTLNNEITENTKSPYLLGKIDKSGLENGNYQWFTKNYQNYNPDSTTINEISDLLSEYNIILFMGTWCGDSKREVPKIYKILEAANFPMEQLTTVAVGRTKPLYKKSPQHEEEGLNIHRVPTLILSKKGKEHNRIVEHPVESFEKDIQTIITNNNYESNYAIVTTVNTILDKKGIKGLKKKTDKLINTYKEKVLSMYELNTYARVLLGSEENEKAIAVLKLNTKFFPDNPKAHISLSKALNTIGNKDEAIKTLENALTKLPDNTDIKKNLEAIKTK